ncbi:GIY-YIG nuclease family protein [Candidatus Peregrinibacteria bacterium]|nr:GIY-YIG nuclease family protein [Candidatus Peregrinibacteria bacterium]
MRGIGACGVDSLFPFDESHASYTFPVPHFFYIARCSDGSLYAGTCVDLAAREARHNDGRGAKYTRSRRPVIIIYHEEFSTLSEARKREALIKTWSRERKEGLIAGVSL